MASTIPSIRLSPNILESPADWDEWLAAVQACSRAREILHLIDLTKDEQPTRLLKPTTPTLNGASPSSIASMTVQEMDMYKILHQKYKDDMALFNIECKTVQELVDFIYHTVSRANLNEV